MTTTPSAILLLVRETTPEAYDGLSAEERRQSLDRWNAWVDEMGATGKLAAGEPLESARRVVSGSRGERVVDGPFAEAKEVVGGFFLLANTSLDEATALAQRCPNLPYGMSIELRPIAGACHLATSIGWQTMRGPANA